MFKHKMADVIKKDVKKVKHKVLHIAPKEKIQWSAPEFYFYPKNRYWILGIGILMLGLVFMFIAVAQYIKYQLVISDYLLMVGLVLAVIVFGQYGHIEPKKLEIGLDQEGLKMDGKMLSYELFKSFWILEQPNPIVYFETVKFGLPVSVLLEGESPDEVRGYLLRYLPEHPTAMEHVTDKLNHFLRF